MKYFYGRMETKNFQNEGKLNPFAPNAPFLNLTVF